MKFFVSILLIAVLSFISGLFLPWWGIAIDAFLVAIIIPQRSYMAFFSGFLGVFLLWAGLAWWIDMKNNGVLSHKMANVLPLGGNYLLVILASGLVGGLVAAFASLSGSYLRMTKSRR